MGEFQMSVLFIDCDERYIAFSMGYICL